MSLLFVIRATFFLIHLACAGAGQGTSRESNGDLHVLMDTMRHRPDFGKIHRCNGMELHQVFIAIKQLGLDMLKQSALSRSTPGSPDYRQWLSFKEVSDIRRNDRGSDAVLDWLKESNVNIEWVSVNRDYVKASTTIAHWELLLHTSFYDFQDLSDQPSHQAELGPMPRRIVRRAESYRLPRHVSEHVHAVFSVTDLPPRLTKHSVRGRKLPAATEAEMSPKMRARGLGQACADDGLVSVQCLRAMYGINAEGSNQTSQSVFEAVSESFSPSDLRLFQQTYGLLLQQPTVVGGTSVAVTTCAMSGAGTCFEGNLDIQYIMGVAQGTASVYYYQDGSNPFIDWIVSVSNSEDPPTVNSISWGSVEQDYSASHLETFNNEAASLANRGVTILVSAGDSGVHAHGARCGCDENSGSGILHYSSDEQWSGSGYFPSFPATSPYVTAVGGTMGLNEGAEEVACQANAAGGIITTGSGFSTYFPTPSWQQQAVDGYFGESGTAAAAGYNQRGRGYPDISLTAVNYPVFINGDRYALYGTSASCPVMAAMVSLLNAERLMRNEPSIGWLNPTLYSAGYNVTLPNSTVAAFNDVTTGDSKCCSGPNPTEVLCCESGFIAAEGWDPVTGWGSVNFQQFLAIFGSAAPAVAPTSAGAATTACSLLKSPIQRGVQTVLVVVASGLLMHQTL